VKSVRHSGTDPADDLSAQRRAAGFVNHPQNDSGEIIAHTRTTAQITSTKQLA
jgi:hypothetical protein